MYPSAIAHRVRPMFVIVVEAHQAGLGDRRWHRVEAIEPAGIRNELRPLGLERLPDCLLGQLRMAMRLGVGDAFIEQPCVHLVYVLNRSRGVKKRSRTSPTWF